MEESGDAVAELMEKVMRTSKVRQRPVKTLNFSKEEADFLEALLASAEYERASLEAFEKWLIDYYGSRCGGVLADRIGREITAYRDVLTCLKELGVDERRRILKLVAEFYGIDPSKL